MRRVVLLLLALFLLNCFLISLAGFYDENRPADVALILGSRVYPNGQPSPSLEYRLEKGLELYRSHRVNALIVSGGLGRDGFQEAALMRQYLEQRGVPSNAIIEDDHGDNTRLSAVHTRDIMRQHGWRSVVVVTQYYHIARSKLALRQEGLSPVTSARARFRPVATDPWSILREGVGYWAYLVHGS